jgi:lipoprotein-releasing system permease protein
LKLPIFFARKYFLSKRKKNFIHFITMVSMIGVAVGTMSLIVVLSVFNGLENVLVGLYSSFDSDLKVLPAEGKSFEPDSAKVEKIRRLDGIVAFTEVIEDNALAQYRSAKVLVKVKGINPDFLANSPLNNAISRGNAKLMVDEKPYAIVGRGVQYFLNLSMDDPFNPIVLYYPKNLRAGVISPGDAYTRVAMFPSAIFSIEKEYDDQYILIPLDQAARLTNYGRRRTGFEIRIDKPERIGKIKDQIIEVLGPEFRVLNAQEQHEGLLKALRVEKLFVYFTFSFILIVASFNIFFSLSLLAIEKRKDIAMLFAMGAKTSLVRNIFLMEGILVGLSGALIGLVLGVSLCILQDKMGLIGMGAESSIIEFYPVELRLSDITLTIATILLITFLISFRPAFLAGRIETSKEL